MNIRTAVLAALAAIVIGAAGYLAGIEVAGRGPSAAVTAAAVKEYLAANPAAPAPTEVAELSNDQRSEVEGIIRGYLMANPEIIRDAINELQRRQDEAEQAEQVKAISENGKLLFTSEHQVVIGNPKGDVTLVEFFDYNCGYCKRAQADMKQLLAEDKNLKVVLKEFPVLGEGSVEAAQVSVAVKLIAPEKAGPFHDTLLAERGQVNGAKALAVAEELGIDQGKLKEAMKTDAVRDTITEVYTLAQQLALTGTPSYVTSQEVIVGAVGFEALKEKIAAARAACASANC